MDMPQPMQLFHFKVYPNNISHSYYHTINWHFLLLKKAMVFFLLVSNSFRFYAEVACQLGYDDLYSVTAENMTLEVKRYSFNANMLRFVC